MALGYISPSYGSDTVGFSPTLDGLPLEFLIAQNTNLGFLINPILVQVVNTSTSYTSSVFSFCVFFTMQQRGSRFSSWVWTKRCPQVISADDGQFGDASASKYDVLLFIHRTAASGPAQLLNTRKQIQESGGSCESPAARAQGQAST
jgi:hypothetical protein